MAQEQYVLKVVLQIFQQYHLHVVAVVMVVMVVLVLVMDQEIHLLLVHLKVIQVVMV